eukprot:scaffold452_cov163-Skeletonema_marinoi.AAC.7
MSVTQANSRPTQPVLIKHIYITRKHKDNKNITQMKNEIDRSNTPLTFNWVEDSEHLCKQAKRPGRLVYYGPLTLAAHERYQQNKEAPNVVSDSSKNSAAVKHDHEKAARTSPTVVVMVVIATASLAFVVAIPFGLFAFLLIESSIQSLRNTLHSQRINSVADAANVETVAFLNKTLSSFAEVGFASIPSSAILKYAKMAIWPFLLFMPSFFLFSHLIIGMTSENQGRDRKKMTWKVLLSLVSLFAFMETMLAMAYASKWTLLGITSTFPLLMMILARLSLASADKYGNMLTPCVNFTAAAETMDQDESMVCKCIV